MKKFLPLIAIVVLAACSQKDFTKGPYDSQQAVCDGESRTLEFQGNGYSRSSDDVAADWISSHNVIVDAVIPKPRSYGTLVTYHCTESTKL